MKRVQAAAAVQQTTDIGTVAVRDIAAGPEVRDVAAGFVNATKA
jgi:hypothetical protein